MRKGYIDGPDGQMHYREQGEGHPVLLLHQAPMSSLQYLAAVPCLADMGFRAIAVDYPGFGQSDPPKTVPPMIADYARAALSVMDGLGIERFAAVGHHTGAMVATELALMVPDRVSHLAVHGPYPATPEERAKAQTFVDEVEKPYAAKRDGSHLMEIWERRIPWGPEEDGPERVTRYLCDQISGSAPFWYGHNAAFAYDHAAALEKVSVPGLILSNSGDMTHDRAQQARKIRPDFAYADLEGYGVDIADQATEAWCRLIADFLSG